MPSDLKPATRSLLTARNLQLATRRDDTCAFIVPQIGAGPPSELNSPFAVHQLRHLLLSSFLRPVPAAIGAALAPATIYRRQSAGPPSVKRARPQVALAPRA